MDSLPNELLSIIISLSTGRVVQDTPFDAHHSHLLNLQLVNRQWYNIAKLLSIEFVHISLAREGTKALLDKARKIGVDFSQTKYLRLDFGIDLWDEPLYGDESEAELLEMSRPKETKCLMELISQFGLGKGVKEVWLGDLMFWKHYEALKHFPSQHFTDQQVLQLTKLIQICNIFTAE